MNTLTNSSSPSALKMAPSTSQLRFEGLIASCKRHEKRLFCQHNQRLVLWENQESLSIQAQAAKEARKRESINPTHWQLWQAKSLKHCTTRGCSVCNNVCCWCNWKLKDLPLFTNFFSGESPQEMNQDDATWSYWRKGWFKSGAVGVNKLNGSMKAKVQKAGIQQNTLLDNWL